ncbi:MAG TPA: DUF2029 domain-containing protein [Chloroflexi bacterium]|nr:DUF2029 domain-containing protein [Chloroflexota bacterium]
MRFSTHTAYLVLLLLVAFGIRILASLVSNDIVDVQNYGIVAEVVDRNGLFALYGQTPGIYPYPPLWVEIELLSRWAHLRELISFSFAIRLPIILADVGIVAVLWAFLRSSSPTRSMQALIGASLYALNPVSIIITCLHGQFDAIPVFFVAFAMLLHQRLHWRWSAIALSLGIALKSFPVLLLPSLALQLPTLSRRAVFVMIALAPVLLLLSPFLARDADAVIRELISYRGAALLGAMVPLRSIYVPLTGQSFPVELTSQLISLSAYLFLAVYAVALFQMYRNNKPPEFQATVIFLLFYTVYLGIAPQYLLWVLPFMIMTVSSWRWTIAYSAVSTLALIGFYLYAVEGIFPYHLSVPHWIVQVAYGLFGSLWWIMCGAMLIRLCYRKPTQGSLNHLC